MPETEEKQKETVDIDTSGPEVSRSTIGSFCTSFLSSGIVSPMVKIRGIYLRGSPRSLKLHHH